MLTALLLGAGASRELGMPLRAEVNAQILAWLFTVMGTLKGSPNPPALWLRRAKPAYAHAIASADCDDGGGGMIRC